MANGLSTQQQSVERIVEILTGWLVSRALHVGAELGIADLLRDGPRSTTDLAAATSSHPQSLYRLVRMLASYGIFAETGDGRFELTPAGALLQSGALRDMVRMFGDADWNGFGALLYNIKTGEPAFKHVNGAGFFDYFSAHPEAQQRFDSRGSRRASAHSAIRGLPAAFRCTGKASAEMKMASTLPPG
jgi:hypothetical protein